MKKFLFRYLLFLVLVTSVVVVIHIVAKLNHQFLPNKFYYADDFTATFETGNSDVLILGNSKVLSAIDKPTLEKRSGHKVGQFGYSSSNISVSKLILESYLSKCTVNPKVVLLEVSWFTFNTERTGFHDVIGDLFIEDVSLWSHYKDYNSNILLTKIKKAYKKSLISVLKSHQNLSSVSYEDTFKKASPTKKSYVFDYNKFEQLFPDHVAGINEVLLRDFKAIVNMCEANNIALVLFSAPEDEEYSRSQQDIKKIKTIYRDCAKENANVYYLDYTFGGSLYDKKFEFWLKDSHHINEKTLFTKHLLKDLKSTVNGY